MKEKLKAFAESIGIDQIGVAPVRNYTEIVDKMAVNTPFCERFTLEDKTNPFLSLEDAQSIIVYLIPYNMGDQVSNLSRYSWVRDYHEVAAEISAKITEYLESEILGFKGKAFCDLTPLPQKYLAYLAGLGFFGDNHLLINEKYGSWFFIAHIITNYAFTPDVPVKKSCLHCGRCKNACPSNILGKEAPDFNTCVSMITQKKSPLSKEEEMYFKDTVWGCDACQVACPYNEKVNVTPLSEYFGEPISYLNRQHISLKNRPFSYKKEKFILRNLELFEKQNQKDLDES